MTIIYFIRHSIAEEIKLKRNTSLLECNKNTRLTKEGRIPIVFSYCVDFIVTSLCAKLLIRNDMKSEFPIALPRQRQKGAFVLV